MIKFKSAVILLAFFALLRPTAASGQERAEVDGYQKVAGWDLPLFRGKLMPDYPFRFNGTFYIDNKGFRTGSVCFGGKTYDNINLNIDAYRQALYVRYANRIQIWELDRDLVEWFTMGKAKYVNLRAMGYDNVPAGFYEVVYDGDACVYKQVTKALRESVEINGYYRIGYEDPNYNNKIFTFFEHRESFWYKDAKGKVERFKKKSFIINKYPAQKKAIKRLIKERHWDDLPLDIWCKAVMKSIEDQK